jgi:hypothetical protein
MCTLRPARWLLTAFAALALTTGARPQSAPPKNPSLQEVPIDLDLSDPKAKVDPVVFFEAPDPYGNAKIEIVTGLLRRELYRQGVLLAARDELGLVARDGSLGDSAPDDLPPNNRFRVNPRFVVGRAHEIKIEVGPAAASRVLWRAEGTGPALAAEQAAEAVTAAEALSRGGYITALKRAGLRGKANPVDPKAAVPDAAEKLLGQMTFTAQFAAARLLHDAIRTKGESAATLGALSRAYATLGMLTDMQWGTLPWVCKARGLLYAERLRQRDPNSPWGHWHRAYAAALAGMHATALADLKEAERVRGTTSAPGWVGLTDALCRFDTARLKEAVGDGPLGDTASLFHFLTVENTRSPVRALAAGAEVLKRVPDCYRVHDALAETGGVAAQHSTTLAGMTVFTETFRTRLTEMPGLPQVVADALPQTVPEADLVKALAAAGKSRDDRGEPSWAALGKFAQDTRLVQVNGRLMFLRHVFGVPTDEFFAEAKPLVADHPLFAYIETFTLDPARQRAEYQKKVRALKVPELTYRDFGLLYALQTLGEAERVKYSNIAIMHGDNLYYDAYLILRRFAPTQNASQFARRMLANSPYAPMARAEIIAHDPKVTKDELAAWEKEAQHPEVFMALARRALAENRPADAEKPLTKAIELSPDQATYRLLAEAYRKKGDEDKWLATLEKYLKEPDPGLGHAQVRVEIANHFMAKKDYKRAQPYAEAAADTWAAWAMLCASKCADGLEEWDKAEQWARNVSERYQESVHVWFFWCLRTGHGDRAAAQQMVEKHLEKVGTRRSVADVAVDAVYQAATGKREKTAELFLAVHQRQANPAMLLTAALEYDALGDKAKRDRALAAWPEKSAYAPLVTLLRKELEKGEKEVPTKEEVEAAFKQMPADAQSFASYVVGRFLLTRGQKDLASEYLKRCIAESASASNFPPALAGLCLQELEQKK